MVRYRYVVRGTWYGTVRVRVRVRYGTVQYGTVLYNMLRYGMVRYTMATIQYYSYIYINILIYIYYTIYITHHHTLLMYIPYYMLRYITYIVMKTTFVFKNKPNCLFRFWFNITNAIVLKVQDFVSVWHSSVPIIWSCTPCLDLLERQQSSLRFRLVLLIYRLTTRLFGLGLVSILSFWYWIEMDMNNIINYWMWELDVATYQLVTWIV